MHLCGVNTESELMCWGLTNNDGECGTALVVAGIARSHRPTSFFLLNAQNLQVKWLVTTQKAWLLPKGGRTRADVMAMCSYRSLARLFCYL